MIGRIVFDFSAFDPGAVNISMLLIIAALIGAIMWNLITWFFGLPYGVSSHALIGGMVGAALVAYGPGIKILWGGLLFVVGCVSLFLLYWDY